MTTIPVPSAVAEQLRNATSPAQLVDERGRVLGSFSPAVSAGLELTPEELAELKRRMASPGPRYSTEQVIEHLRAMENP
jgi:hypothetical protein